MFRMLLMPEFVNAYLENNNQQSYCHAIQIETDALRNPLVVILIPNTLVNFFPKKARLSST